jgi:hypothetical protein
MSVATFCADCWFHNETHGVRCLKHTPAADRQARAAKVGLIRIDLLETHPVLRRRR